MESSGNYWKTEDGLYCEGEGKGDNFIYSNTNGKDFVYETDVTFNSNSGAASLVFRADKSGLSYVANLDADGNARVFKFDKLNNVQDMGPAKKVTLKEGKNRLKVVMIGKHIVYYVNGEIVLSTADYGNTAGNSHFGQNDVMFDGYFGLLTFNGNMTYQNTVYSEITDANNPVLDDLSVKGNGGDVVLPISYNKGQFVYITYVDNTTKSISLNLKGLDQNKYTLLDGEGKEVKDLNNIALNKSFETFTLLVKNGDADIIYRLRVHKQAPKDQYYNEDWRGQYHYSVLEGWGNDPCGMVYQDGVYHFYHQYYDDIIWGPMHWIHTTSTDMIHWTTDTITTYPDEYGTMFSGCAVSADHTTAPDIFKEGEKGIVFFITANGGNGNDQQRIIAAVSKDNGKTFQKYEDGKVLIDWTEDVLGTPALRDPKVFRYENTWFMVVAGGPLRIYSSENLIDWNLETAYGDLHTECPDLYPLEVVDEKGNKTGEVKWVLDRGGRKYKIGDFKKVDGHWQFIPMEQYASTDHNGMGNEVNDGIMNFGPDSYAAMTFYIGDFGTADKFNPQNIVSINWMNTWEGGFNNAVSVVNGNKVFNGTYNLALKQGIVKTKDGKYLLTQTPIDGYKDLRKEEAVNVKDGSAEDIQKALENFKGDSYELVAVIHPENSKVIGFKVRAQDDTYTTIYYDTETGEIVMDRTNSGVIINSGMSKYSQKLERNEDGSITIHLYIDRASVEFYNDNFTVEGAMQIFPAATAQGVEFIFDDPSAHGSLTIYQMDTIWKDKEEVKKPFEVHISSGSQNMYVGDETTLNTWVSDAKSDQGVRFEVENPEIAQITQNGNKVVIKALKKGSTKIRVISTANPELSAECEIKITEDNFNTNLKDETINGGNWIKDDEVLKGQDGGNAFWISDYVKGDSYTYAVDVDYTNGGILNLILRSKETNPFAGSYVLQVNGRTLRLFDFLNDRTFVTTDTLEETADKNYHVEAVLEGNHIIIKVNGKEYLDYTVEDEDRQYSEGHVGLGLFNTTALYKNFLVTSEAPVDTDSIPVEDITVDLKDAEETLNKKLPVTVIVNGKRRTEQIRTG